MKTYTKTHTSRKAASAHLEKIRARGGKYTLFEENGSWNITYHFPEKEAKSRATEIPKSKILKKEKVLYDIISPDGFTIRMPGVPLFQTRQAGSVYFEKWKKRFEAQGYYSSNKGRIQLIDLADECSWEEVPVSKAKSWLGFKMR